MTGKTYGLTFGNRFIRDITNPRPEEIDVAAIQPRLRTMRRFSNNPEALTVAQHVKLAVAIAVRSGCDERVASYLAHHDDHEAFIGDIPGPIKHLISEHTRVLDVLERHLDLAIWEANGRSYYLPFAVPEVNTDPSIIADVAHHIDKTAETVEWLFVMGQPRMFWNKELPDWLVIDARSMIAEACR